MGGGSLIFICFSLFFLFFFVLCFFVFSVFLFCVFACLCFSLFHLFGLPVLLVCFCLLVYLLACVLGCCVCLFSVASVFPPSSLLPHPILPCGGNKPLLLGVCVFVCVCVCDPSQQHIYGSSRRAS